MRTSVADVVEIEEYVASRWPGRKPWSSSTRQAWVDELARFDAVEVWSVVHAASGSHPPQVMELVDMVRSRLRVDRPLPRQLAGRVVSLAEWIAAHGWTGLADALHREHADDCVECSGLGVPREPQVRVAAALCEGGVEHVWGSVDCVDLADDGRLTLWCSVCGGEMVT